MGLRIVVALAILACTVAHAQADDKPWAAGVPADTQRDALALYQKANALFEQGNYKDALPVYEQALALWQHPGIHYNTAVCLINLDRSVEAYTHLQKAMAYGEAPLGKDLHTQGLTYLRMLAKQVGTLEVTCNEPGARVMLDGKELFVAPSTVTTPVLATEPHQIVAEKDRYDTETKTIRLEPGKTTTLVLEMKLRTRGGTVQRRWSRWKPWAVVAAGGVIGLVGAPLLISSKSSFEDYDRAFNDDPDCMDGCLDSKVPPDVTELKTRGEREQTLGISAFAVGGATIAVGIALVVLNQPRLVGTSVTPMVGSDRAGAILSTQW